MKYSVRTSRVLLGAFAGLLALPATAAVQADAYPTRPIRFLVGFAAGGANDLVARLVSSKLGPRLGQQIIVDNRPGGGGQLAHELLVNAAPDGYTMILASVTGLAMAPGLRGKLPYDPVRDFAPVVQVVDAATLFSAHPSSVSRSLKDFVARVKQEPGKITVGNPGTGSRSSGFRTLRKRRWHTRGQRSLQEWRSGSDRSNIGRGGTPGRNYLLGGTPCQDWQASRPRGYQRATVADPAGCADCCGAGLSRIRSQRLAGYRIAGKDPAGHSAAPLQGNAGCYGSGRYTGVSRQGRTRHRDEESG